MFAAGAAFICELSWVWDAEANFTHLSGKSARVAGMDISQLSAFSLCSLTIQLFYLSSVTWHWISMGRKWKLLSRVWVWKSQSLIFNSFYWSKQVTSAAHILRKSKENLPLERGGAETSKSGKNCWWHLCKQSITIHPLATIIHIPPRCKIH